MTKKEGFFQGRKLVIATMHDKEKVIAPILEGEIGVNCFTDIRLDTDQLGTFTGEIERKNDVITTLRNKCLLAMEISKCDLAVASEGSFGMHPSIFFVPADDELVMLLDTKNNLEIVVRELSTDTNFSNAIIKSHQELEVFAHSVGFPAHGLIARKTESDTIYCIKGISNWEDLNKIYTKLEKEFGLVYFETDMRAMYNPTRMKVIEQATLKLIERVNSLCPECRTPGFGVTEVKPGLPCSWCHSETRSTLSFIYACSNCSFSNEEFFPNNKQTEDPIYCDFCNP